MEELKNKYLILTGCNAGELSKSVLKRYIIWHEQAKEQKINWKKLEQSFFLTKKKKGMDQTVRLFKDGTKLLRHWQGATYTVITQGNSFIYNNKSYKSLSKIAKEITGTNWNGKLFFKVGG